MNPAACSWRVTTSSMLDVRSDSSTSEVLFAGDPEHVRTPSCLERLDEQIEAFIADPSLGALSATDPAW